MLAERGGESFLTYFGGAIGTFAAIGGRRRAVEDEVARFLGLSNSRKRRPDFHLST